MISSYYDGFIEAMMRNLTDEQFRPFTSTITYDPSETDYGWDLRFAWPGSYRTTLVACETRGLLVLEELHVPLATELMSAMRRLDDIGGIIRAALPADLSDTELLRTGVVVYASDWDVAPSDDRIEVVRDESHPETTLLPLFARQFTGAADPHEVDHLVSTVMSTWPSSIRECWLDNLAAFAAA